MCFSFLLPFRNLNRVWPQRRTVHSSTKQLGTELPGLVLLHKCVAFLIKLPYASLDHAHVSLRRFECSGTAGLLLIAVLAPPPPIWATVLWSSLFRSNDFVWCNSINVERWPRLVYLYRTRGLVLGHLDCIPGRGTAAAAHATSHVFLAAAFMCCVTALSP